MKCRPLLVVGLYALVVAVSCGTSSEARGGSAASHVLTSRTYGYQLSYPSTWSALAASRELMDGQPPVTGLPVTDIVARHASRRFRELRQPALVVGAQPVASGSGLDEWVSRVIELVDRFKGCAAPDRRSNTQVGGTNAVALLYRNCPRGSGLYHVWTVLVRDGQGYQLVWFDASRRANVDRRELNDLLTSLRFTR